MILELEEGVSVMPEEIKLGVSFGGFRLDYVGPIDALSNGSVGSSIEQILKLDAVNEAVNNTKEAFSSANAADTNVMGKPIQLTTLSVAQKLGAKTASELAFSAVVKTYFVDQLTAVTRDQIHEEMKTAHGIYKSTMSGGNLTKALETLMKSGKINEIANKQYSLVQGEISPLRQKLGDA